MPHVLLLVSRPLLIEPQTHGPVVVAVSRGDVEDIFPIPDEHGFHRQRDGVGVVKQDPVVSENKVQVEKKEVSAE